MLILGVIQGEGGTAQPSGLIRCVLMYVSNQTYWCLEWYLNDEGGCTTRGRHCFQVSLVWIHIWIGMGFESRPDWELEFRLGGSRSETGNMDLEVWLLKLGTCGPGLETCILKSGIRSFRIETRNPESGTWGPRIECWNLKPGVWCLQF